ncbi:hypothetical protein HYZ41_03655 [archaeon]|nr:hypothetical protein [archaeon]
MGQLAHCAKIPVGIFAFSDDLELIYFRLFSRSPEKAFQEFSDIDFNAVKELASYTVKEDEIARKEMQKKFREYALSLGFAETDGELNSFLCRFCRAASRKQLEGAIGRDRLIMQAANAHEMKEIAPNTSSIIDEMLAARLIALAGSLEKFARMTSSTIQLLGAEKALFRHLHKKGKSPKYGLLYTSSVIQKAQPDNRGKAARILSAHLMKAARIDFYSGRYEPKIKEEMKAELRMIEK